MGDNKEFAPKDAETLQAEVLEDLGLEELEGNEEQVDKVVARRLKDEEFKASLHSDKNKHLEGKNAIAEKMRKAGLDPETGEKLQSNDAGTEKETPKNEGMSLKDIRALQDVDDEDVDEVLDFAKYKGISVAEAKASPVMQTLLKTRTEERATANASSTGNSKKGSKRNSGAELLNNFKQGKVSENDEDIAKLVQAEQDEKRAIAKGNN